MYISMNVYLKVGIVLYILFHSWTFLLLSNMMKHLAGVILIDLSNLLIR